MKTSKLTLFQQGMLHVSRLTRKTFVHKITHLSILHCLPFWLKISRLNWKLRQHRLFVIIHGCVSLSGKVDSYIQAKGW